MRIILTGPTGFVGSHVARRFHEAGSEVHALVRSSSDLSKLRTFLPPNAIHVLGKTAVEIMELLKQVEPQAVIHIASWVLREHQIGQVEELAQSNIVFPLQLVEAAVRVGVPYFVDTGTYWEHWQGAAFSPVCLYAAMKRSFRDLLQYYFETGGIRACRLKLFDVYGPKDQRPKLLNSLFGLANGTGTLALSPGDQWIDLVHVDDVSAAYVAALEDLDAQGGLQQGVERPGQAVPEFFVSGGRPIRVKQLVGLVEKITGRQLCVQIGARPYRRREMMVPVPGGPPVPNWHPQVKLEDGLRQVWKGFQARALG